MNIGRLRYVAPAGAPIGALDLARWLATLMADPSAVNTLCQTVARRVGVKHCRATSTGRAAMTVVLRSLKRLQRGDRDEVIVPAYTCYSVAASIVRAGLKPRIVDISAETLDFDWTHLEAADCHRVLAIVATNLYGIPNDMPRLVAFAKQRKLFLVDDAAQAFGAAVGGRPSGTWGDVGVYSLDKGKNVSAIDGGLIVSNHDMVARTVDADVRALPKPKTSEIAHTLIKLGAYATMLRPSLYWIPNAIPQLGLGRTVYDTSYVVEAYCRPLAALALVMLPRLDEFTAARRANAAWLRARLERMPGISLVQPPVGSEPVYLRFPILVDTPALRDPLVQALNESGIGATGSYPRSIADIHHLASYSTDLNAPASGSSVAARIVTLPTHPFVSKADLQRTVDIISMMVRSHAGGGVVH